MIDVIERYLPHVFHTVDVYKTFLSQEGKSITHMAIPVRAGRLQIFIDLPQLAFAQLPEDFEYMVEQIVVDRWYDIFEENPHVLNAA